LRDLQQAALYLDPWQLQEEAKAKQSETAVYMVRDSASLRRSTRRFPPRRDPSKLTCWCCNKKGHKASTCPKLCVTLDEFHKGKCTKEEDRGHEEQAMIAKESIYLDSAASSHMTNKVD